MRKYRIQIEGKNFLLKEEYECSGFFTTRYVEQESEEKAIESAMNLIRDELKFNVSKKSNKNPEMFVQEIVELESFGDANVPGSGFSWYPMEE